MDVAVWFGLLLRGTLYVYIYMYIYTSVYVIIH